MNTTETGGGKIEQPHAHFDNPHEVVVDPALSKSQKEKALDTLEQDARQLSAAADEGMAGGEPTNLQEVLDAKEALELPPTAYAYEIVLRDLHARQAATSSGDIQALIAQAIQALEGLKRAAGAAESVNPPPGSAAEIAKETQLEKLDP